MSCFEYKPGYLGPILTKIPNGGFSKQIKIVFNTRSITNQPWNTHFGQYGHIYIANEIYY